MYIINTKYKAPYLCKGQSINMSLEKPPTGKREHKLTEENELNKRGGHCDRAFAERMNTDETEFNLMDETLSSNEYAVVNSSTNDHATRYFDNKRINRRKYNDSDIYHVQQNDRHINEYQWLRQVKDSKNIRQSVKTLQKFVIGLGISSIVLIAIMIIFMFGYMRLNTATLEERGNNRASTSHAGIPISEHSTAPTVVIDRENDFCLPCSEIKQLLSEMVQRVRMEEDSRGLCCMKSTIELTAVLLNKIKSISQSVENVLQTQSSFIINYMNESSPLEIRELLKISGAAREKRKSAIHLVGNSPQTGQHSNSIVWSNQAELTSLYLSYDRTKVRISESGNYFMYVRVSFDRSISKRKTGTLSFKVYQRSKRGIKVLEDIVHELDARGSVDSMIHVNRVAHLFEGDLVYIHINPKHEQCLSKSEDAHEFGMFQI